MKFSNRSTIAAIGLQIGVLIGLGLGANAQEGVAPSGPAFDLKPCHIKSVEELARCGTLEVPENHNEPDGRKISLNITVLPPSGGQPTKEPLYFLAGGPGQAATEQGQLYTQLMRRIRRGRDLVLVDQRGTGKSNPFTCVAPDNPLADGGTIARACLDEKDHAPAQYTSDAFIQDLELVRIALGHQQISLMGISYGTRAALLYTKAHEDRVRAMVLDSVAPPHIPIFRDEAKFAGDVLTRTLAACLEDADCGQKFPTINEDFGALLQRLAENPVQLVIPEADGLSFEISRDMFLMGFRGALYSPPAARLIPFIIDRAHDGDLAPWLALADFGNQQLSGGISLGLLLSVQCAEEVVLLRDGNAPPNYGLFPNGYALFWKEACENWPVGTAPAGFNDPVKASTPTLLISGGLDPITPPAMGEEAAQYLSNARHLVVPYAGHSVIAYGCTNRLVADFLDSADPASVDATCLEKIKSPPFLIDRFGPKP